MLNVLAYLDPGTGSLLIQIVLAGLAGIAVGWKYIVYKTKQFFGIVRGTSVQSGTAPPSESSDDVSD